ncbi:MAG TPA: hypothetical protein VHA35_12710 [Dongiaceae bacterium]|nr:hypothetical protein [Dongiaceae bacterium]
MTVSAALAEIAEGEAMLDRAAASEPHNRRLSDEADRRLRAADAAFAAAVPESIRGAVAKLRCAADTADFCTEESFPAPAYPAIREAVLSATAHLEKATPYPLAATRDLRRALAEYRRAGVNLPNFADHIESALAGLMRLVTAGAA